MTWRRRSTAAAAAAAVGVLTLAGCSASPEPATPAPAAEVVTLRDAWVKSAETGMTAGFGDLVNAGPTDVTITAMTTDASARSELHETVADASGAMVMRAVQDGFVVPAGGAFSLEPAGSHLMMMDLTGPLTAGDEVTMSLEFSDGSELDVVAVVKDYSGAQETYEGESHGSGSHGDSDH